MKKNIILTLCMVVTIASCTNVNKKEDEDPIYTANVVTNIVERNIGIFFTDYKYYNNSNTYSQQGTTTIYKINNSSIPYVDINYFVETFGNSLSTYSDIYSTYQTQVIDDNTIKVINSSNQTTLTIDFVNKKATYNHFVDFFNVYKSFGSYHFAWDVYNLNSFIRNEDITYNYYEGDSPYTIDLNAYNIDLYKYNDKFLIPFNTASVLLNLSNDSQLTYTEDGFYFFSASDSKSKVEFNIEMQNKGLEWLDQEYMESNYNNFALYLDEFFGVSERESRSEPGKVIHYLEGGAYNALEPYKNDLLSTEKNVSNEALKRFFVNELDDGGHTTYTSVNLLSDEEYSIDLQEEYFGKETLLIEEFYNSIYEKKKEFGIDSNTVIPSNKDNNYTAANGYYKEYADTAYITFDDFTYADDDFDFKTINDNNYYANSMSLFYYANEKIQNNENIKNVIIDLSTNLGGYVNACQYISSWCTGGTSEVIRNSKTHSLMEYRYNADVNFDGHFDEKDYLDKDINLYVITSKASFSSANKLACNIKDNRLKNTYFVGSRTAGGCCSVTNPMFNYLGAGFEISSQNEYGRLGSTIDNFISADVGVEPDERFSFDDDYASYADINKILDIVHQN